MSKAFTLTHSTEICTDVLLDPALGKDTSFDFTSVDHTSLTIKIKDPDGAGINVPILTNDAPYYKCIGECSVSMSVQLG